LGWVSASPPSRGCRASRQGWGRTGGISVVGVEGLTSNCKRPTLSVHGGLCTADSSARAEVTIGSKEQALVWGIVIVKKSPRTLCLGSVLAPLDGKGGAFGTAIPIAEALHPEVEGQLEGKGHKSKFEHTGLVVVAWATIVLSSGVASLLTSSSTKIGSRPCR
jgi:hypothetical protein